MYHFVTCNGCKKKLAIPDGYVGRVKCKNCNYTRKVGYEATEA